MHTERIHGKKSVIAGVPSGGGMEVVWMAENHHTHRIPLWVGAVRTNPVAAFAPDVLVLFSATVEGAACGGASNPCGGGRAVSGLGFGSRESAGFWSVCRPGLGQAFRRRLNLRF